LRDQLKAGLSATAQMQGDEAGPSVSDLAEKIKALKAAHSIEATPQRARQKQSSAEEPVTARIRRRTEAIPMSNQVIESDVAPEAGAALEPASSENSSIMQQMTFQERLAMERQRKSEGPPGPV
jgi:hypothetical protein